MGESTHEKTERVKYRFRISQRALITELTAYFYLYAHTRLARPWTSIKYFFGITTLAHMQKRYFTGSAYFGIIISWREQLKPEYKTPALRDRKSLARFMHWHFSGQLSSLQTMSAIHAMLVQTVIETVTLRTCSTGYIKPFLIPKKYLTFTDSIDWHGDCIEYWPFTK